MQNNDNDIVFQVLDWEAFDQVGNETDDQEDTSSEEKLNVDNYLIRLYGMTNDKKKIFVEVTDFSPYFFVKIPKKWRRNKVKIFINVLREKLSYSKKYKKYAESLVKWDIIDRHLLYGFTNNKLFQFIKLTFANHGGFRACASILRWPIHNYALHHKKKTYEVLETNIQPMIRFMHIQNLNAAGWIKIKKHRYTQLDDISSDDITITTKWTNVKRHEDTSISPFVIASYDLECVSGDGKFPQPERPDDKIIQIGTTFNNYSNSECFLKHIITLGSCDPIEGAVVESYETEQEVLIAWKNLIIRMNPDIMTGYNIFGFDYRYLEARAKLLKCSYQFAELGRLIGVESTFIKKELSSSALGRNNLLYYEMAGRVQIDLMKVVMRDYNLSSYKLDNVASHFIKGSIKKIILDDKDSHTRLTTDDVYGLAVGRYVKLTYNDGFTDSIFKDGKKYKILAVGPDYIDVDDINDIINDEVLNMKGYKKYWCQAKDDVKPYEIFALQRGSSSDRARVAEYCLQDCELVSKLMEKLQIVTNNISMSNVCSTPLQDIFLRGQGIKILSLVAKECRNKNYLMPLIKRPYIDRAKLSKIELKQLEAAEELEKFEGATVLRPHEKVHYAPVVVLDYAALYPRSMIHRNISHDAIVLNDEKYGHLPEYNYFTVTSYNNDGTSTTCKFAKHKSGKLGIIPEILDKILTQRAAVKVLMKAEKNPFQKAIYDGMQLALKLTANSIYGQTGARTSPIYYREIAASTTATGREMLNGARVFTEHIYSLIMDTILAGDRAQHIININLLFDNKLDELLGPEKVKYLKKHKNKDNNKGNTTYLTRPSDYYYLRIYAEKQNKLIDKYFVNKKLGYNTRKEYIAYLYTAISNLLKGLTVEPICVYGDTDSIFVDYGIRDAKTGKKLHDHRGLVIAIQLGVIGGHLINYVMPEPQDLEYEKTFWPWISLSKKRYVGNLYEFNPNKFKQKAMGIVLKRRDNSPIVKIVVGGIVDQILNKRSAKGAITYTKACLRKMLANEYPIDKFIITKTLKDESAYKFPERMAHVALAARMGKRDPGNKPQSNDRIPYVYVEQLKKKTKYLKSINKRSQICHKKQVKKVLQGDKVEHPVYVIENNLKVDNLFYITNQVMKPSLQFLEKMVKNPERIFNKFINMDKNRRKGVKPIMSIFNKKQTHKDSDSDDFINFDEEVKLMPQSKPKKRRPTKRRIKKPKTVKLSKMVDGGFNIFD